MIHVIGAFTCCQMLPVSQVSPASRNLDPVCLGIQRAPGFVSEENQSFPEQGEQLIPAGISQPDHNCYCRDGSWAEWTEDSWCVFNAPKLQIFLHISEYYAIFVLTLWWYKKELQRSLYRLTPIHMFKMNKASLRFRVLLEGKTWDWAPSFYINQPPCSN